MRLSFSSAPLIFSDAVPQRVGQIEVHTQSNFRKLFTGFRVDTAGLIHQSPIHGTDCYRNGCIGIVAACFQRPVVSGHRVPGKHLVGTGLPVSSLRPVVFPDRPLAGCQKTVFLPTAWSCIDHPGCNRQPANHSPLKPRPPACV